MFEYCNYCSLVRSSYFGRFWKISNVPYKWIFKISEPPKIIRTKTCFTSVCEGNWTRPVPEPTRFYCNSSFTCPSFRYGWWTERKRIVSIFRRVQQKGQISSVFSSYYREDVSTFRVFIVSCFSNEDNPNRPDDFFFKLLG